MLKVNCFYLLVLVSLFISCTNTKEETIKDDLVEYPAESTNKVKLSSEIKWEKLNPARGDKSPQAGTVWGDRNGTVATGFLAKFVDGFSSPPHIHNVTYRAMVIKGLVHNDDPNAAEMWMPAGSFWTQPAGESHITSAKGEENIAYVEIDRGPYLVKPIDEAFDKGERPVNIDKRNIIWLDASKTSLIGKNDKGIQAKMAFLWEDQDMTGNLIKIPAGFEGYIHSEGAEFHAVVIEGELDYKMPKSGEIKSLDPGSYFTSTGLSKHSLSANKEKEAVIYIRTNGIIKVY